MAVVPPECTTSYTEEEHGQSLRGIANGFGQVMSLDKLLTVLRG
jgi:hypothetical protein